MAKTAVVILNYNGVDYLKKFLPSLLTHTPEAEIVVADNQSNDDSVAYLRSIDGVRVIELPENYGYAGGYNAALQQVHADYFVLVNSDIEVTAGWLPPLIHALDSSPGIVAAQPKILSYHEKTKFEYAGAAGGYLDLLAYPYCRGRIFNTIEEDHGQYNNRKKIFWASGACFIIRADTFHELKGFDPDFFAHMEEIDLCWRIHSNGWKVSFTPDSTVYHVGGGTLNKANPRKTYLNFRNGISLIIKNMPFLALMIILPIRIALDLIAGVKFWSENKDHRHLQAVFNAHRDSILRFGQNFRKRKKTALPPDRKLIIWEYFIRGKKRFNEL